MDAQNSACLKIDQGNKFVLNLDFKISLPEVDKKGGSGLKNLKKRL